MKETGGERRRMEENGGEWRNLEENGRKGRNERGTKRTKNKKIKN
jgi:hypothetical protein